MSLLLAFAGSASQTITASGLSNPSAMGVATASLNISASGIAQSISFGSATLTIAGTEEPSVGFWFDGWDWRDHGRRDFKPRAQRVSCHGISQRVGYGVATLTTEQPDQPEWRKREEEELVLLFALMG